MDIGAKSYPAKLLLLGEYAVLQGCDALGIPYHRYSGRLSISDAHLGNVQDYLSYLYVNQDRFSFLDRGRLQSLIQRRVGYDSDIPMGYGLGSSAALTAAIYDICQQQERDLCELLTLQDRLAEMESFFHGRSSGFDPLISLLQKPIHKTDNNQVHPIPSTLDLNDVYIYLYDSGTDRNTHGFVPTFLERATDNATFHAFYQANNLAIAELLSSRNTWLKHIQDISTFQLQHMSMMIPEPVKVIWEQGLKDDSYYMKLCGAGGGGYFLIMSNREQDHLDQVVRIK